MDGGLFQGRPSFSPAGQCRHQADAHRLMGVIHIERKMKMADANEKKSKPKPKRTRRTRAPKEMPKTTRFIISHRRAGHGHKAGMSRVKKSRDNFEASFDKVMASNVDLLSHNTNLPEDKRGLKIFDADYLDVNKIKRELSSDTIVERLITRKIQVASPFDASLSSVQALGTGKALNFHLKYKGSPVQGISVTANFSRLGNPEDGSSQSQKTNINGKVTFEYDDSTWKPYSATFNPRSEFWPQLTLSPLEAETIELIKLPKTGPLNWWQNSVGVHTYDKTLGKGIKVGIVDTGVGPHPYLDHVTSIGSFIDSHHDSNPRAGLDSGDHGTHVSGIIGARLPDGSNEYTGIVPGAEVFMARVFPKGRSATQGDISFAVDTLASEYGVHLINMSLGSTEPSRIERDAIEFAMECGTLCFCAAGNGYGKSVDYPAAYPETVAVSGLGVRNVYPEGTISSSFYPAQADRYSPITPFFLASYSNIGKQIVCCAPGTGIISTVPAYASHKAPYLSMDGTSMASPMATAALAARLSTQPDYMNLPAGEERFQYAAGLAAAASSHSLNLLPVYQGYGLINRLN